MNGVEAAASLFGSEESDSDPFATLGTATAESDPPQSLADDLFFTNSSAPPEKVEAFSFPPHEENPLTEVLPSEYPSVAANGQKHITSGNVLHESTSAYSEQWADNNTTPDYAAAYPTLQSEPPETANYKTYVPTTTHPSYGSYDPPAPSSTYTIYPSISLANKPSNLSYIPHAEVVSQQQHGTNAAPGPYDAPTATVNYTPYNPGTVGKVYPSEMAGPSSHTMPSMGSQVPYNNISSGHSPYDPPASYSPYTPTVLGKIPPGQGVTPRATTSPYYGVAPPPVKSAVTRPKVSNAYDPPFIPTLPSRRTSRQSHNTYQPLATANDMPHESYGTPSGSSLIYDDRQSVTPPQTEYGHAAVITSPSVYAGEITYGHLGLQGNSPLQAAKVHDDNHSDWQSSEIGQPDPLQSYRNGSAQPEAEESRTCNDNDANFSTSGQAFSSPKISRPSSINPISDKQHDFSHHSPADSVVSNTVSPRSIPLPFSPPVEAKELQDSTSISLPVNSNPNEQASQQNPYVPLQASKRDPPAQKDPYAPRLNYAANSYIPRTSSPLSLYGGSPPDVKKVVVPAHANGVVYSSVSRSLGTHAPVPPLNASSLYSSDDQFPGQTAPWSESQLSAQDLLAKPTSAQYAPSPSLIGANDPLSRTSARAPVVAFGFGGKLITCFHGMPGLNAGFDVALSARTSSELKIHTVRKIIPESALNTAGSSYPGPLFSGPGTSSIGLVRSGQTTQSKTKKTGVLTYLSGRASELHQGLGYLSGTEKQLAENRLIIIKLLSIMVENDGRLLGNPQSDAAVRSTLVPRLENLTTGLQDSVSLQAAFHSMPLDEAPISVTSLRPSTLDKIEELLLQGDRRQAYQFATDQKLWAHAMIIASSIDKESWKDVVNDFLRSELGNKEDGHGSFLHSSPSHKNRDTLRVAYSLYSGQGMAAVQELAPVNLLQRATNRLQAPMVPVVPSMTPRTPNFPPSQPNISLPPESLVKWAETAAMIISSPLTPETAAALTTLGDQLFANDMTEAAHSCYLLSSQASLLGGFGHPSARMTLLGAKAPAEVMRNVDPLIFSEILEFALSLLPTAKGQEPFHGLPYLQAYRFVRAVSLAETGDIQLANKYCDAIAASLSNNSPYTTVALLEQLQGLQQRLSGVFHGDKSSSWITGKISKPSLDSIGGWLEGRFTKLVTGETDSPTPIAENARSNDQPFSGPFAHYSTISSTTPSARSSPQPTPPNPGGLPPPQRTTSAMATSSPYTQVQIERSSSAMGYMRQKPAVQITQVNTGSISSSQSSPTGYGLNGHSRQDSGGYASKAEDLATPVQRASWWDSMGDQSATSNTPTATTFMQVEESSLQTSGDGFISLMDNHSFSVGPSPQPTSYAQQTRTSSQYTIEEDLEEDLGLGNSKPKHEKAEEKDTVVDEKPKPAAPPTQETKETPAPTGGSWLSRWWKKSDASPGPIKASLGDDSAFYYDNEQKRWVNRKASAEASTKVPTPPPPPPARAQTASPGMTGPGSHLPPSASAAPPRPVSAIDLGSEPPVRAPMRIRSNLAPPTESAPSTPTGSRMSTP
ncbi:Sec23-binding domain of Sec16-domain-containing protein [Gymnopilus junonius]|uniref:Protein transport protein sec16 n=1 Tax=Gymnopilus junonius TaxID=109634 RepID=A0A9P5NZW3_GYMJU|nr:Sec23-binding domain of Sec16-domain-containing protein [Gymnopilus junonius]